MVRGLVNLNAVQLDVRRCREDLAVRVDGHGTIGPGGTAIKADASGASSRMVADGAEFLDQLGYREWPVWMPWVSLTSARNDAQWDRRAEGCA